MRELVDAGRGGAAPAPAGPRRRRQPFTVTPTPDAPRVSGETAWDETTRPSGPAPDPGRRYSPDQQAAAAT